MDNNSSHDPLSSHYHVDDYVSLVDSFRDSGVERFYHGSARPLAALEYLCRLSMHTDFLTSTREYSFLLLCPHLVLLPLCLHTMVEALEEEVRMDRKCSLPLVQEILTFKFSVLLKSLLKNVIPMVGVGSRYEKRHANIPAHVSPCFRVSEGDTVVIGQCR